MANVMIGIIAGPDGPTAVYLGGAESAAVLPFTAVSAAVAVLAAVGICVFLHHKKK